MKKLGLISIALAALLTSSSAFASDKKVFIDIDTKNGSEILKSELEYKSYLDKKIDLAKKNQLRIESLQKQCDDINVLKIAVAKLIKNMNNSNNQELNVNIKILMEKVDTLSKENDKLHKKDALNQAEIAKLKEAMKKLQGMSNNFKAPVAPKSELKCESDKKDCITKTIRVVDKKTIKHSYYKMSPEKEFKVSRENFTYVYEYPVLGEKKLSKLMKGDKFIADKYTAAGWVHAKGKGWVKGYVLSPKLLRKKDAIFNPKKSAFIEKKVLDCDK